MHWRAHAAVRANHPEEAIAAYREVLRIDPGSVEAQGNLGVLLYFQHDCLNAQPYLEAALAQQSTAGQLSALLGLCEAQGGKTAEAEDSLRAALPAVTNPRVRTLVLTRLTQLSYTRGNLDQASTDVAALIKDSPDSTDSLYLAYCIYRDLEDAARNRLAAIAPDSARSHQLTAQRFINNGNATMAIRQYREALEKDPDLPGIHFEIGEAMLEESVTKEARARARAEFVLALQQDPRNAGAEAKLGVIESIAGNAAAAQLHFKRALDLNADELDALLGMAEQEQRRGDVQAALGHLEHASHIDALNDSLHFRIAQIYRAQGDRSKAEREVDLVKLLRELKSKTDLSDQQRATQ